ncbi:hypothetical protein KJ819_03740 [Patescibacteria group bacterium]|nr:hypothetical protein [Patescibacteria group bacterium]MBU1500473.1 hypothetical protein [Patescibacteria group bacterium]MBU2080729.1 hypothetical protein [Patescibacteria group bacterium]MBU2123834.1 hypothetical protein [Patescibacteria group bacterium]MBU2194875.1 hypothetical protein [Patescibacteria group bacterium]
MKTFTIGAFVNREDAEKAINQLHNDLKVPADDISYVYRNTEGEIKEEDADDIARSTVTESAGKGAAVGGTVGALAGLAAFAGIIPVIGPLFAAGPIAAALGFTGAVGAAAAGGVTGAAAGGILAGLVRLGISEEHAQRYVDRVEAGDVLVAAHTDKEDEAVTIFKDAGASNVETYQLTI